jgi:hypothetical protein
MQAVEKRSSAVLRCKPPRLSPGQACSTYFYIRLTLRLLRALHLGIFEQPASPFFDAAHDEISVKFSVDCQ